jgi:hypothetical protein
VRGDIASPDVANQSSGRDGLNEVTLDNNSLCTVRVRKDGEKIENERGSKIIDSPKIMVTIFARQHIALLDTGATTSVCSVALYNRIKQLGGNLIAIPTCGLYCSTAIGRKRQRIKLQCMFPVEIGDLVLVRDHKLSSMLKGRY